MLTGIYSRAVVATFAEWRLSLVPCDHPSSPDIPRRACTRWACFGTWNFPMTSHQRARVCRPGYRRVDHQNHPYNKPN